MTSSPECAAYTKAGGRCKRKAEPGSIYCWQHQNYQQNQIVQFENKKESQDIANELLKVGILPELAADILLYTNVAEAKEAKIENIINRERETLLRDWFGRLKGVQKWNNIPKSQYQYLWEIYSNRIQDLPSSDFIAKLDKSSGKKLVYFQEAKIDEKSFDPYIFFSRQYNFNINKLSREQQELFVTPNIIKTLGVKQLEQLARKQIDFDKLKRGDVVYFKFANTFRDYNILIYNGLHLEDLFAEVYYGSRTIPKNYTVDQFSVANYFEYTIEESKIVWYKKTTNKDLKLLEIIEGISEKIHKYQTPEGYIIYFRENTFEDYYRHLDVILLSYWNSILYEIKKDIKKEKMKTAIILYESGLYDKYNSG